MSAQSPLPGEANAHHHHLKITDVINHIVHPHKSTHQHEEEKHVAKQERKGVKTLADGTDPIEEFEPLVQYDAEREKSAPLTQKEIKKREEDTLVKEMEYEPGALS